MAIRQGVTPTFTFTIPETVDLTETANVYVAFKQGPLILTKTGDQITVSAHSVDVFLNQQETILFAVGRVETQMNWVYADGSRGATNVVGIEWDKNLLREVLA